MHDVVGVHFDCFIYGWEAGVVAWVGSGLVFPLYRSTTSIY